MIPVLSDQEYQKIMNRLEKLELTVFGRTTRVTELESDELTRAGQMIYNIDTKLLRLESAVNRGSYRNISG